MSMPSLSGWIVFLQMPRQRFHPLLLQSWKVHLYRLCDIVRTAASIVLALTCADEVFQTDFLSGAIFSDRLQPRRLESDCRELGCWERGRKVQFLGVELVPNPPTSLVAGSFPTELPRIFTGFGARSDARGLAGLLISIAGGGKSTNCELLVGENGECLGPPAVTDAC